MGSRSINQSRAGSVEGSKQIRRGMTRGLTTKLTLDATREQLRHRRLKASSAGRDWGGLAFDEFGAVQIDEHQWMPPRDHHVVTVALGARSSYIRSVSVRHMMGRASRAARSSFPKALKLSFKVGFLTISAWP
jgi:hypothetical protein